MRYISTRGLAPPLGFEQVLLAGLARDGGLYLPESWPVLSQADIAALAALSYPEAAVRVMHPFVGDDLTEEDLWDSVSAAYAGFDHKMVAPLVQVAPARWLLELFHGPTLAFKDIAMQLLARLMDRALAKQSHRITIIGATSGDTGGAAIEAFRGRDAIDIFILHPKGRVSDVQRRQMTTAPEPNVHNIAVEGTFDDCQALVKAMFADERLRQRFALAAVNSINWARIMAQTVYYFTAAVALGAPGRAVSFSVPTGNFGDIFAGYVARAMGLPVKRLVIATNVNDILVRALTTGRYQPQGVVATSSPSMDIQVSSNFERLIFEVAGRDAGRVRDVMEGFADRRCIDFALPELEAMRALFSARRVDEEETARTMRGLLADAGYLADPHTAVGVAAAADLPLSDGPVVSLATAHPAKFPEAVRRACGRTPEVPTRLAAKLRAEERCTTLPNDLEAIRAFLERHARAPAETHP